MSTSVRLALFEPDIPQNAGALLRTAACLGVPLDLIEPAGFLLDDARLKRAGLDYAAQAALVRHTSWQRFAEGLGAARLVLLTTQGATPLPDFRFQAGDVLLLGRESAGVPEEVHARADVRLRIPLAPGMRSLNVAQAGAMVLAEALRQLGAFPSEEAAGREGEPG